MFSHNRHHNIPSVQFEHKLQRVFKGTPVPWLQSEWPENLTWILVISRFSRFWLCFQPDYCWKWCVWGSEPLWKREKVIFWLETRLRSFKTFEISLKSWKWPQKWQKRHGRDVGGKWGPKAFLLKKNSGKTIREEKIEKTFYFFLVFFGRLHKIFKNFQNLFFSGRNFSIFFLAAGFSRIFF